MNRTGSLLNPNCPWTWANFITLLRTAICLLLFSWAALAHRPWINFVGLGVYWGLDMLDGYLARRFNQETRLGAQMDIISDRLLVSFFYLNYLSFHPDAIFPVVLFLFEFCGLDLYLSNQFLRWPILSPNYFYLVNKRLWLLNWSMPGKLFNTGIVTLLLVACASTRPATYFVVLLIMTKIYSCVLMHTLPGPERFVKTLNPGFCDNI